MNMTMPHKLPVLVDGDDSGSPELTRLDFSAGCALYMFSPDRIAGLYRRGKAGDLIASRVSRAIRRARYQLDRGEVPNVCAGCEVAQTGWAWPGAFATASTLPEQGPVHTLVLMFCPECMALMETPELFASFIGDVVMARLGWPMDMTRAGFA
jgi:hypothetical protein